MSKKRLRSIIEETFDCKLKNFELNRGYKENEILMGDDPYSASKSCAEIAINSYIKSFYQNDFYSA